MPALIAALVPILDQLLEAVLPDPAARAKKISEALAQLDLAQLNVNAEEAKHPGVFKGGWRSAIGWCCAFAIFYQYILVPLVMWGSYWSGHLIPKPPEIDGVLWELMAGMLGLGTLHTVEKIKGVG